jgi:hypothetical protein
MFQREERYVVVKLKHMSPSQFKDYVDFLTFNQIPTVECAVVESDWPEYEPVWKMIQERVEAEEAELRGAWCPACCAKRTHHGDPDSIHLHLCDTCNCVVDY